VELSLVDIAREIMQCKRLLVWVQKDTLGPEKGSLPPHQSNSKYRTINHQHYLWYHTATMGKQSKRNKRRNSSKKQHNPTGLAADPLVSQVINNNNTEENESPTMKIIQKIRHGDPR